MNLIDFQQKKRSKKVYTGTLIDMMFYRVYHNGSFEATELPTVEEGFNRIPFFKPDVLVLRSTIPQIDGYKVNIVEKSEDSKMIALTYIPD